MHTMNYYCKERYLAKHILEWYFPSSLFGEQMKCNLTVSTSNKVTAISLEIIIVPPAYNNILEYQSSARVLISALSKCHGITVSVIGGMHIVGFY